MGHSRPLFPFIFAFSTVNSKYFIHHKILPMPGFELRTSGIGSNHSANWATTTALKNLNILLTVQLSENETRRPTNVLQFSCEIRRKKAKLSLQIEIFSSREFSTSLTRGRARLLLFATLVRRLCLPQSRGDRNRRSSLLLQMWASEMDDGCGRVFSCGIFELYFSFFGFSLLYVSFQQK